MGQEKNHPELQSIDSEIDQLMIHLTGQEFFKSGFERLTPLFSLFNKRFKEKGIKIVTVGGTNGKGGTVHFLEQLLVHQNIQCASFTSPHILSASERMKVQAQPIDKNELLNLIKQSTNEVKEFGLSYYETLFYVFLKYIDTQPKLEVILLEVGLGGRLDAVNHMDCDIAVITSISRDHTEILGHKLSEILTEKLGIIRKNISLFSSVEQEFLRKQIKDKVSECSLEWMDLYESPYQRDDWDYKDYNYHLALEVFKQLGGNDPLLLEQIVSSKGRGELMTLGPRSFIFIGAHNIDGLRKMTQSLISHNKSYDLICLSFSKRSLEEIEQCLDIIAKAPCLSQKVWVTVFDHGKSMDKNLLKEAYNSLKSKNVDVQQRFEFVENYKEILSRETDISKVLVTGSYYFIGEFQQYIDSLR